MVASLSSTTYALEGKSLYILGISWVQNIWSVLKSSFWSLELWDDCTRLGALRQISIFWHMSGADFLSVSNYLKCFMTLSWWSHPSNVSALMYLVCSTFWRRLPLRLLATFVTLLITGWEPSPPIMTFVNVSSKYVSQSGSFGRIPPSPPTSIYIRQLKLPPHTAIIVLPEEFNVGQVLTWDAKRHHGGYFHHWQTWQGPQVGIKQFACPFEMDMPASKNNLKPERDW